MDDVVQLSDEDAVESPPTDLKLSADEASPLFDAGDELTSDEDAPGPALRALESKTIKQQQVDRREKRRKRRAKKNASFQKWILSVRQENLLVLKFKKDTNIDNSQQLENQIRDNVGVGLNEENEYMEGSNVVFTSEASNKNTCMKKTTKSSSRDAKMLSENSTRNEVNEDIMFPVKIMHLNRREMTPKKSGVGIHSEISSNRVNGEIASTENTDEEDQHQVGPQFPTREEQEEITNKLVELKIQAGLCIEDLVKPELKQTAHAGQLSEELAGHEVETADLSLAEPYDNLEIVVVQIPHDENEETVDDGQINEEAGTSTIENEAAESSVYDASLTEAEEDQSSLHSSQYISNPSSPESHSPYEQQSVKESHLSCVGIAMLKEKSAENAKQTAFDLFVIKITDCFYVHDALRKLNEEVASYLSRRIKVSDMHDIEDLLDRGYSEVAKGDFTLQEKLAASMAVDKMRVKLNSAKKNTRFLITQAAEYRTGILNFPSISCPSQNNALPSMIHEVALVKRQGLQVMRALQAANRAAIRRRRSSIAKSNAKRSAARTAAARIEKKAEEAAHKAAEEMEAMQRFSYLQADDDHTNELEAPPSTSLRRSKRRQNMDVQRHSDDLRVRPVIQLQATRAEINADVASIHGGSRQKRMCRRAASCPRSAREFSGHMFY